MIFYQYWMNYPFIQLFYIPIYSIISWACDYLWFQPIPRLCSIWWWHLLVFDDKYVLWSMAGTTSRGHVVQKYGSPHPLVTVQVSTRMNKMFSKNVVKDRTRLWLLVLYYYIYLRICGTRTINEFILSNLIFNIISHWNSSWYWMVQSRWNARIQAAQV